MRELKEACENNHFWLEGRKYYMERPYVICHILSSLDGKINGPFMGTEAVGTAPELSGKKQ